MSDPSTFAVSATALVTLRCAAKHENAEAASEDMKRSAAILFAQVQLDAHRLGITATVEPLTLTCQGNDE